MEHIALYRRYRPMTFDEIVEQDHAVSALRQSVRSGKIGHAYLFSGTRGTGKTSIAKVFSRAINCLSPSDANPCNQCAICRGILDGSILDVIEMDAASNNSVDNIRRICDEVLFLPSQAKYKVYIVDEVHMLSTGAFNALLKTLEEPPEHAVFILATTEPHRIPATIISRCQRYDFRRIPIESIVKRLGSIAKQSQISIDNDALIAIASLADGALRDAISLLDQVGTGASKMITSGDVYAMVGLADRTVLFQFARSILTADVGTLILLCDNIILDGRDILRFTLDLAHFFRDLAVVSVSQSPEKLLRSGSSDIEAMRELAQRAGTNALIDIISALSELSGEMKWSPDMRTTFEIALVSISKQFIASDDTQKLAFENPVRATLDTSHAKSTQEEPPVRNTPPLPVSVKSMPANDTSIVIEDKSGDDTQQASTPAEKSDQENQPAQLTPNLTRAVESKRTDNVYKTNLSTLVSGSNVRKPNIPLPPSIPDEDVFAPPPPIAPSSSDISKAASGAIKKDIKEQWDDALLYLEKHNYDLVLFLRHARIVFTGTTLRAIFPERMAKQVRQLTQADDYKRIIRDITARLDPVDTFDIVIEAEGSSDTSSSEAVSLDSPEQPDWVQRMLDFARSNNIPVESTDAE